MKRNKGQEMMALAAFAITIAVMIPTAFAQNSPSYDVTNLGTLGGTLSTALGINNLGLVTGAANLAGDKNEHAFAWYRGQIFDLGTAGGPNSASGFPLKNERGFIPVISQTPVSDPLGENWAFHCDVTDTIPCDGTNLINVGELFSPAGKAMMPTLGGNNSQAWGANNLGQVVGVAETAHQDANCVAPQILDYQAVIWTPRENRLEVLPLYPGDTVSGAIGINDRGQAVGASGTCAPISPSIGAHALLWENGQSTYLGTLGGQLSNLAYAINNHGQVVGLSDLPGEVTAHAFMWENGIMSDLGTLPGDVFSAAFSINNKGQVAGESCDVNFNCRAFLWQQGTMTDLNTLIPVDSSLYLLSANDLNDRGEIVGQALDQTNGATPAFLIVPCDETRIQHGECEKSTQSRMSIEPPKVVLSPGMREQLRRTPLAGRLRVR